MPGPRSGQARCGVKVKVKVVEYAQKSQMIQRGMVKKDVLWTLWQQLCKMLFKQHDSLCSLVFRIHGIALESASKACFLAKDYC